MMNRNQYYGIFFILMSLIIPIIIYVFTPPVPQWSSYHQFADTRTLAMLPNFFNVVSNAGFLIVSMIGFRALNNQWQSNHLSGKEAVVFLVLFSGILLAGIGSAYYHWSPDNNSLVWDRMPITLVFMSLLSLTIMERISNTWGFRLLIPLLLLGIFSVLYWHWTELSGHGDLRLYGLVQFYTMFLIIVILLIYPKPYPPSKAYVWMFVFYLLAKVAEYNDVSIFNLGHVVSGHTLKHIFAALSTYFIIIMLNAHPRIDRKTDNHQLQ